MAVTSRADLVHVDFSQMCELRISHNWSSFKNVPQFKFNNCLLIQDLNILDQIGIIDFHLEPDLND